MSFFSETSMSKPIDALLHLTNLNTRELSSELDLPYQTRSTSSVELVERLGLWHHLSQGSSHPLVVRSLPAATSSLGYGLVIDPNAGTVDDTSSVMVFPSGASTTVPPYISAEVLSASTYMPQALTLPRPAPDLLSPTSNIMMSGTSSPNAKWLPASYMFSLEPESPGRLVEIRTGFHLRRIRAAHLDGCSSDVSPCGRPPRGMRLIILVSQL
jgi:hypothetical protein